MGTMFTERTPPLFNGKSEDYPKWKRKFVVWRSITDVSKAKHGGLLVLRLDDETQDSILELMTCDDLKKDDGVEEILGHLDNMFQKDESITAFELYEELELYRRPDHLSVREYCSEFQKRLSKVKSSGTQLSEHVLAHRLLKSANLSKSEEQLIRATVDEMTYEKMAKQLKKVFNQMNSLYRSTIDEHPSHTLYGSTSQSSKREFHAHKSNSHSYGQKGHRKAEDQSPKKHIGKNRIDIYGDITRCTICDSINHWKRNCLDRETEELELYPEDGEGFPNKIKSGLSEPTVRKMVFINDDDHSDNLYVMSDGETDHRIITNTETENSTDEFCANSEEETTVRKKVKSLPHQHQPQDIPEVVEDEENQHHQHDTTKSMHDKEVSRKKSGVYTANKGTKECKRYIDSLRVSQSPLLTNDECHSLAALVGFEDYSTYSNDAPNQFQITSEKEQIPVHHRKSCTLHLGIGKQTGAAWKRRKKKKKAVLVNGDYKTRSKKTLKRWNKRKKGRVSFRRLADKNVVKSENKKKKADNSIMENRDYTLNNTEGLTECHIITKHVKSKIDSDTFCSGDVLQSDPQNIT